MRIIDVKMYYDKFQMWWVGRFRFEIFASIWSNVKRKTLKLKVNFFKDERIEIWWCIGGFPIYDTGVTVTRFIYASDLIGSSNDLAPWQVLPGRSMRYKLVQSPKTALGLKVKQTLAFNIYSGVPLKCLNVWISTYYSNVLCYMNKGDQETSIQPFMLLKGSPNILINKKCLDV